MITDMTAAMLAATRTQKLCAGNSLEVLELAETSVEINGSHYIPLFNPISGNKNPIAFVRSDYVNSIASILDDAANANKL